MDGADDGAAALGQPFHQGHHLEAGGTVQATASQRHREMLKNVRDELSAPGLGGLGSHC